jgi:hypothetical protein
MLLVAAILCFLVGLMHSVLLAGAAALRLQ